MSEKNLQENIAIVITLAVIVVFFSMSGLISFDKNSGINLASSMSGTQENNVVGEEVSLFDGGVVYVDSVIGEGEEVVSGSLVTIEYLGKFDDGTVFDSSYENDLPIKFIPGIGMVIPGFDAGVMGMRVGGKRTIRIMPEYGYGEDGIGPIPGNAILIFDVEVVGIEYPKVGEESESL
ncbi:peptidylprolyl isomerase [Candidatus Campbellbacteria bacterium CG22_combo_CG10-13_8_21_14_all_36_13]|uniref:Peptidyl-prolyl cis-trans isomerase n=1 Tax=Candidatus Campbellbacteria bacterium CG22_combo_CG10-13_8_21_14_all_36_13 TaxID=1974529 RepID=A0A2H0DXY2_9BACT|nr:MAG: peptidylprolyl isomerase [Candidatus Campbellbacteria bacterium CG22_combo_CG10-13_8_21_14_all_36_13]